eukprot:1699057-Amphidinium_carterae.1
MSSMPTLIALFQKPHQIDYQCRIIYETFATCRRVLECQQQIVPLWCSMWHLLHIPASPLALLRLFVQALGWKWSHTPFTVYSPGWNCESYREWNMLVADEQAFLHEVRAGIRSMLLGGEAGR